MIYGNYIPFLGDEFIDKTDGSNLRITSIDSSNGDLGVSRSAPGSLYFNYEIVSEVDFVMAVDTGVYEKKGWSLDKGCWHSWEQYTGFTRLFKFCSKCGVKKDGGN